MLRVFRAIEARMQNWQAKHFEKTRMGKRISALKDIHRGESCFVIGNGPSLKADDLQKLHELNIPCFATNRIYHMFEKTDWRPTYYASEDIIIIRDIQDKISEIPARKRFIPINLHWYENVNIDRADWFYMEYADKEFHGQTSSNVPHAVQCKGTVTITCIQLAVYMGFSDIYLIGVDHNYAKITTSDGRLIEDRTVKDYFSAEYDKGIKNDLVHNVDQMTKAYCDVEQWSRENGHFKVYNATRGGKLEVFDRADLDDVLAKIEGKKGLG